MVEAVRGEVREDLRDLRREVKDLVASLTGRPEGVRAVPPASEGESR
jgi:hypothetical protein